MVSAGDGGRSAEPDREPADPGYPELRRALTGLAEDPDAPPSTVSVQSILAAAQAGTAAQAARAESDDEPNAASRRQPAPPRSATVIELRSRRRPALIALLAAAAVAAIAAVVIPLSLSGSSTSTSADSARVAAPVAGSQQNASAAAAGNDASAAAAGTAEASAAASGGGAAVAAPSVPGQAAAGVQPSDSVTESCWPPLGAPVEAELSAALPAGEFGPPAALSQGCDADPVGGALLTGLTQRAALVVRVSRAAPGACAVSRGEAGSACTPKGAGYLGVDAGGGPTAYAYGNGYQVSVGGPPPSAGAIPVPSGLTADQAATAAAAVLGALG